MAGEIAEHAATCEECGEPYPVTIAEQVYYREHGARMPVRCPVCRARGRAERNAPLLAAFAEAETVPITSEHAHGIYGGQSHRPARAGGHGMPRPLHPAICASCGQPTEVPFIPRGGRPIYCRACFAQRRQR